MNKYNEIPNIVINEKSKLITISGNSMPEDSKGYWYPFISELKSILERWDSLTIDFKFDMYNTSTTSHITRIMDMLMKADQNKLIVINWYYIYADEDMMESGQDYKDLYLFKHFNLIERK